MDKTKWEGFVYAEDLLRGGEYITATVTISAVWAPNTEERADGQLIDKWVLAFEGSTKRLALCKTNVRVLQYITGEQPGDDWIGRTIQIQPREVQAFGETVIALRVVPPTGTKIRKAVADKLGRKAVWKAPK